jgi:hypothetical protein
MQPTMPAATVALFDSRALHSTFASMVPVAGWNFT